MCFIALAGCFEDIIAKAVGSHCALFRLQEQILTKDDKKLSAKECLILIMLEFFH